MSGQYSVDLSKDVVYSALGSLIAKEPLLGVTVGGASSPTPWIKRLETVDLDKIVSYSDEEYSEDEVNSVISGKSLPYDVGLPGFRVRIYKNRELLLLLDHALIDGGSSASFHRKFLEELRQFHAPLDSSIVVTSSIPILPKMEDILDLRPSPLFLVKSIWNSYIMPDSWQPKIWTGPDPVTPFRCRCANFEVPFSRVQHLLTVARASKVTLTAIFAAALTEAIIPLIPESQKNSGLHIDIPMDARQFFPDKSMAQELGNYVLLWGYDIDSNQLQSRIEPGSYNEEWAKAFSKELRDARKNNSAMCQSAGLLTMLDSRRILLNAPRYPRGSTMEISNLGVQDFSSEDPSAPTITKLSFAQGGTTIASYFTLSVVSIKGGPAVFSLATCLDDSDSTVGKHVRDRFLAILNKI